MEEYRVVGEEITGGNLRSKLVGEEITERTRRERKYKQHTVAER